MDLLREEGAVTSRAVPGPALYRISTFPKGQPKAVVGLLHGYADHGARYQSFVDAWARSGIATVSIDMRGHGRASGARGYCRKFDEYLDDATELARIVGDRAKGAPTFLFGHSFGGLVATLSVMARPESWKGLVLSSPYYGLAMKVPAAKVLAGRVASRLVPGFSLPTGIRGSDVTHDERRARDYEDDPLVFKNARARWFVEAERAQKRVRAGAPTLQLPVYMFFGDADPIASCADGKAVFEALGSSDKTWREHPGLLHEVWNEVGWEKVVEETKDWIFQHLEGQVGKEAREKSQGIG